MENLKLLSEIALSFQNIDNFSNDMNEILEKIGKHIDVSRIYIFLNETENIMKNTFEWCSEPVKPQINNLQKIKCKDIKKLQDVISQNGYISLNDIREMPQDIKETLKPRKIEALVAYSLNINNKISGLIGFDECRYKRVWTEEELQILATVSAIISNAYERKFSQQEIIDSETNFQNFFQTIDDMFFVADANGKILICNNSAVDKLGYSISEFNQMTLLELHPEDTRKEAALLLQELLRKERRFCPIPFKSKCGNIYSVESRVWTGKWNKEDCIYSVSKDLTKENEDFQVFSKMFENNPLPMAINDVENRRFIRVNPALLEKTGYSKDDILGKSIEEVELFVDSSKTKADIKKKTSGQEIRDVEVSVRRKDGKALKGLLSIEDMTIQGKESFLMVMVDITDRIVYEDKILELSNRDSLTNIYNRRYIYDRVEEIIEEYKRTGQEFSICILDMDRFKSINDTYGHQVGDAVLKEFTKVLENNLRSYDLLGRYGGEEFIIILKNSDVKANVLIIERISKIIRNRSFKCCGIDINFTFSAGIANSNELKNEDLTIDELVKIADKRMYDAKKLGRNTIVAN